MSKTTLFLLATWLVLPGVVHAQQDPLYSQYLLNPVVLNPAYTGFNKQLAAYAGYRKQWAGFNGSPASFYAMAHSSILDNRAGIGVMMMQDKIGSESTSGIQGMYSYHLPLKKDMRLSFGIQAGMINYQNEFSDLMIDQRDPRFQQNISVLKPTLGAGLIFSTPKLYAGLSVPRMLNESVTANDEVFNYYNRHAYLMLAYLTSISYNVKLKPFVVSRLVQNSNPSLDVGFAINANNAYTFGAFTRNMHTFGVLVSADLGDKLRFGYVFELPGNRSTGTNFTSHELTIGFRMKWFRFHDMNMISDF